MKTRKSSLKDILIEQMNNSREREGDLIDQALKTCKCVETAQYWLRHKYKIHIDILALIKRSNALNEQV